MAVTAHTYTKLALSMGTKKIDFTADTFKVMLLSAYTVGSTQDSAQFVSDVLAVSTEASGTGYTSGGVALSSPTSSAVKVHYATSPGSATAADFGAVSGDLTIPARATTALVAVRVKPDTTVEPMEQFTLTLSASTGAPIDRATAAGSILDDD